MTMSSETTLAAGERDGHFATGGGGGGAMYCTKYHTRSANYIGRPGILHSQIPGRIFHRDADGGCHICTCRLQSRPKQHHMYAFKHTVLPSTIRRNRRVLTVPKRPCHSCRPLLVTMFARSTCCQSESWRLGRYHAPVVVII